MATNLSKFEENIYLLYSNNIPLSTITTTLKKDYKSIKNALNRIRKKLSNPPPITRVIGGRINKLSFRTKRQLNRDLEKSPKKTNKRLLLENNISISIRGLQRFLKEEGYSINIANKKPVINKAKAKIRVSYCKEQLRRLKNKEFNLEKVIFSDESGIESGKGARQEYYRKRGKKGVGRERISMANKSKFKKYSNRLFPLVFLLVLFLFFRFLITSILIKL